LAFIFLSKLDIESDDFDNVAENGIARRKVAGEFQALGSR
jgi:hypothetical protein